MREADVRAMCQLAGIKVLGLKQIENQYWPASYVDAIRNNPWWLIQTDAGTLRIGNRKRVIHLDWEASHIEVVVTDEENVTVTEKHVHAWTVGKMVDYMITWRQHAIGHRQDA